MIALVATGVLLSGWYMVPLALVGPAASGFSSGSILQAGVTTTANYMIKKSTGKTFGQHAYAMLSEDILKQSYFPKEKIEKKSLSIITPKLKPKKEKF